MCTQLFDPKVDYIFKNIFGNENHPKILISFLNACIKPKSPITSVKIKNTELTKEYIEESTGIKTVSLRAVTQILGVSRSGFKSWINRGILVYAFFVFLPREKI